MSYRTPTGLAGLLTLGLAANVAAQTVATTPLQNVNAEGVALSLAIANNDYQLTQTIYESSLVYRARPTWDVLWLRPDSRYGQDFPAFQRALTVRLSTAGVPSPELAKQGSFSANHGTDLTTVLNGKTVSFPAYQTGSSQPAPFSVRIPLDTPFPMSRSGHVLVEIETQKEAAGPTQWTWFPDAEQWQSRGWTVFGSVFGNGCGIQQAFSAGPSGTGQSINTSLRFARQPGEPPTHPAVAWIGTSDTQWGPFPLPLSLALIGGTGCAVYTEPLATFVGQTGGGSSEGFTVRLPIPRDFALLGQSIFSQTMVFDPSSGNPAGLRVSPGAKFFFSSPPDPYRALTLQRRGSPGDDPQIVLPDRALVLGVQ